MAAKIGESEDEGKSQPARPIRIATDGLRDKVRPSYKPATMASCFMFLLANEHHHQDLRTKMFAKSD